MRFTPEEVRGLAALARIEVDEAGAARLAEELTSILAYVDRLGEVDASADEAGGAVPRRPDVARVVSPEPLLAASEGRAGEVVRVPTVVGEPE
ncbi:MAG: Asp-tRNA(Asn)/Glu-tRNA(Gln) amidotransferase subunit GatC [Myxococcota bacterium]